MLTDVTLFRMAPPTRQNPERNEGSQANPPPPPPPPEAWQAIMAATNANAQMILQLLQERTQGQGNQGNQGQGNNQPHFATLNQFLANQPKSFSYCAEATDADDWLVDINKHFECSNVRPEDFVKFASFQLKDQAAEWYQQYEDSRGGRVITWDDFRRDFKAPSWSSFLRLFCLHNNVTVVQVKVEDRTAIVTTDAERKVCQPSGLQELIDKEVGE